MWISGWTEWPFFKGSGGSVSRIEYLNYCLNRVVKVWGGRGGGYTLFTNFMSVEV